MSVNTYCSIGELFAVVFTELMKPQLSKLQSKNCKEVHRNLSPGQIMCRVHDQKS